MEEQLAKHNLVFDNEDDVVVVSPRPPILRVVTPAPTPAPAAPAPRSLGEDATKSLKNTVTTISERLLKATLHAPVRSHNKNKYSHSVIRTSEDDFPRRDIMDCPVVDNGVIHMPGLGYQANRDAFETEGRLPGELGPHMVQEGFSMESNCRAIVSSGQGTVTSVPVELLLWQIQKQTRLVDFMTMHVVPMVDRLQSRQFPDEPSLFSQLVDRHRQDMTPASIPFIKKMDPNHPTPQDVSGASYDLCEPLIEEERRRMAKRERELDNRIESMQRELDELRGMKRPAPTTRRVRDAGGVQPPAIPPTIVDMRPKRVPLLDDHSFSVGGDRLSLGMDLNFDFGKDDDIFFDPTLDELVAEWNSNMQTYLKHNDVPEAQHITIEMQWNTALNKLTYIYENAKGERTQFTKEEADALEAQKRATIVPIFTGNRI